MHILVRVSDLIVWADVIFGEFFSLLLILGSELSEEQWHLTLAIRVLNKHTFLSPSMYTRLVNLFTPFTSRTDPSVSAITRTWSPGTIFHHFILSEFLTALTYLSPHTFFLVQNRGITAVTWRKSLVHGDELEALRACFRENPAKRAVDGCMLVSWQAHRAFNKG